MVHNMKLNSEPFSLIKTGKKTVEIRLYDDKRRKLDVGDTIIFVNISAEEEKIAVKIKALYREELFAEISTEKCGSASDSDATELINRMRKYYSEEDEKKYGVLGIKVELCDLKTALDEAEEYEEMLYERHFPDGMK